MTREKGIRRIHPFATREGIAAWSTLTHGRVAPKTFLGNQVFIVPRGRAILTEASVRLFRSMAETSV